MFDKYLDWVKRLLGKKGLAIRFFRRERFWLSLFGLSALLGSVLLVWLLWALFTFIAYKGPETSGPAGDKFGGITALFSGLAFAGLVFTLFVQKKELQYQREELSHLVTETRETKFHLEAQASHLKIQSEHAGRQTFENTFFQMLSSFNQFVNGISIKMGATELTGTDALEHIYRRMINGSQSPGTLTASYDFEFEKNKNDLAPYFRQIYNILKFIDRANISNQRFYSNILRSQLSSCELALLFCNGATIHGKKKMTPLVREFDILKYFDDEQLHSMNDPIVSYYKRWQFEAFPNG